MNMIAIFLFLVQTDEGLVAKAAQKTANLKSYACYVSVSIEGGGENALDLVFEGGYSEEAGAYFKGDYLKVPMGIYRKGAKTAVIDVNDRKWKNVDDIKAEKGKRVPGKNFQCPHDQISGIDGKIKGLKKVDPEKHCDVYTAELTESGARSFLPANLRQAPSLKAAGDVKLWINADGYVAEALIVLITDGSANGKDFRITTTTTLRFSKFNDYTPSIPDEAKAALR
jgi:hypothetical protein